MKIITKCSAFVVVLSVLIFFIGAITRGDILNAQHMDSIRSFLNLKYVDTVKITYWPNGDLSDNKITQLNDSIIIKGLVGELEKIPAKGPGRHVKLDSKASEYRVEFYWKNKLKGVLRIKADMLDAPFEKGWDFYDETVDNKFVSLVKKLI
jgi:hypothetical protein